MVRCKQSKQTGTEPEKNSHSLSSAFEFDEVRAVCSLARQVFMNMGMLKSLTAAAEQLTLNGAFWETHSTQTEYNQELLLLMVFISKHRSPNEPS